MLTTQVYLVIQSYSGDVSGNLRGDIGIFANVAQATLASTSGPMGPGISNELFRMNISTTKVEGEDPFVTIKDALIEKYPQITVME